MLDTDRARYAFVRTLSSGGMGRVDLAVRKQGAFTRVLAVKRLLPHHADDSDIQRMFVEEGRIAGLVRHANVVSVQDVGEDADGPYLVMDYVEGVSLSKLLTTAALRGELIPIQVCVEIAKQTADGLSAAHELVTPNGEAGVVHRDVSPSNVLVGFDGIVRVTDFGIARALDAGTQTKSGVIKGKPGYIAPEQLRFESVDARTDLYALGVVLYEMVAGERLYRGPASEIYGRILREAPPDVGQKRRDVPPEIVELWFELASKKPEDRPKSAREVSARLSRLLADLRAVEEPIDLASYLGEICAEDKQEQHILVQSAIAGLGATKNELPITEMNTERLEPQTDPAPKRSRMPTPATNAPVERTPPPTTIRVQRDRPRRLAWLAAAGALVVLLAVGVMAFVAFGGDDGEREPVRLPSPAAQLVAPAPIAETPPAAIVAEPPAVAAEIPTPEISAPEVAEPEPPPRARRSSRERSSRSNAPTWSWR